jgi:hypothetical protein
MPQFRVRVEETAVYDLIVSAKTHTEAREAGMEAFKQGYGDFVSNIETEVIKTVLHANS